MGTPEDLLGAMVRTLPGVVYRCAVDEHWTMQLISDEIEQMTGYPAVTFVDNAVRSYASVIHEDDRARVAREIDAALERSDTFVVEYRLVRADGRQAWVLERGRLVEPAPGEAALDGLIFDITDRKRAQTELRAAVAEQAAAQAVAEERIRIARELHDSVGHALSVIALQAGAAAAHLPADGDAAEAVTAIRTVAADTLDEMDRLLLLLDQESDPRPVAGGLTAVPTLVERVRAGGVAVEFVVSGRPQPLAGEVDALAYRVVQEGLTNALKHAPGAAVAVEIGHHADGVTVLVVDDGAATAAPSSPLQGGRGLAGLRSRVTGAGGALSAGPTGSAGFRLRASLPRTPARPGAPVAVAPTRQP